MEQLKFNGVALEEVCEECEGSRKSRWLEYEKCENCNGTGMVLTEEGEVLLDFINKYGKAEFN